MDRQTNQICRSCKCKLLVDNEFKFVFNKFTLNSGDREVLLESVFFS